MHVQMRETAPVAPPETMGEALIPDLRCPRCGLRIKVKAAFLLMENCPRCLGRRRIVAPLVLTPPTSWDAPSAATGDPHPAS